MENTSGTTTLTYQGWIKRVGHQELHLCNDQPITAGGTIDSTKARRGDFYTILPTLRSCCQATYRNMKS